MSDDANAGMGHNTDYSETPGYVKKYEDAQAAIDEINKKAKEEAAPYREAQAEAKTEAQDVGLMKKPFMALIRERKFERKQAAVRDSLHKDDQERFDQMKLALEG